MTAFYHIYTLYMCVCVCLELVVFTFSTDSVGCRELHMKPAQRNYDLVEPVLVDYSFCLSQKGMPDTLKQVLFWKREILSVVPHYECYFKLLHF